MSEWQPILSAPRDGTKITIKTITGAIVKNAYWCHEEGDNLTPTWSGFVKDVEVDGIKFRFDIYPKFWNE